MNIFVLDEDPKIAASMQCNKHVVKMILESGQMLCAAHWMAWLDGEDKRPVLGDFKRVRDAQNWLFENVPKVRQPPWKMSHIRHPCTLWAASTIGNYFWLLDHMRGLLDEYTRRYKKKHKSEEVYKWLSIYQPSDMMSGKKRLGKTPHPLCVPEEIKCFTQDPVQAYRTYYVTHKSHLAKWAPRAAPPSWWPEEKSSA